MERSAQRSAAALLASAMGLNRVAKVWGSLCIAPLTVPVPRSHMAVWSASRRLATSGESRDLRAFLVACQSNKPRMPQVPIRRPLHKLTLPRQDRPHPPPVFHLCGRKSATPSSGPRLRQVREWTLRSFKAAEPLMQLFAHCRWEPAPGSRGVHPPITVPNILRSGHRSACRQRCSRRSRTPRCG
jgi:hypothetical protein